MHLRTMLKSRLRDRLRREAFAERFFEAQLEKNLAGLRVFDRVHFLLERSGISTISLSSPDGSSLCRGLDRAEEEITQAKRPPNETALRDQGKISRVSSRSSLSAPDPFRTQRNLTRTSSLGAARPLPPSADIGPGGQSVGQAAQICFRGLGRACRSLVPAPPPGRRAEGRLRRPRSSGRASSPRKSAGSLLEI